MTTTTARKTPQHRAPTARNPIRVVGIWAACLLAVVVIAMVGTGGTYALWNTTATASAATLKAGTATLTVSSTSVPLTALTPGTSVVGTFTVTNTGTVPLQLTATGAGTSSVQAALNELTVRLTPVSSASGCVAGLAGPSGRPTSYSAGGMTLNAGAAQLTCLEIALDSDAPNSVQKATATVTLTVTGTQVAP